MVEVAVETAVAVALAEAVGPVAARGAVARVVGNRRAEVAAILMVDRVSCL